ncbi:hypothetical protein ACFVXW_22025 [Streptomyces sp. NPDC058251]
MRQRKKQQVTRAVSDTNRERPNPARTSRCSYGINAVLVNHHLTLHDL